MIGGGGISGPRFRPRGALAGGDFGIEFRHAAAEAFDELVKGILDAPGLLVDEVDDGVKLGAYADRAGGGCC